VVGMAAALALLAGCGGGASGSTRARPAPEGEGGGVTVEAPESAEGGHGVFAAQLVSGEEGWARTREGLFWTADGGRHWRALTSPDADGGFSGVWFADPRHGYAAADSGRRGGASHPVIYSTADGGHSWHRAPLRGYPSYVPPGAISFSRGGKDLFVLLRFDGDPAAYAGDLFVSHDDGRHWHLLPQPPRAGTISFETARRGWLASGRSGSRLWRTGDGGHTWTAVEPASPDDATPPEKWPPPQEPSGKEVPLPEKVITVGHGVDITYMPPLIDRSGDGTLAEFRSPEWRPRSEAIIWRTTDGGHHWRRSATVGGLRLGGSFEAGEVFARRGASGSILVYDDGPGKVTVVGPAGHVGPTRPAHGLPPSAGELSFSDARHGFAVAEYAPGPSRAFTADGGRTWTKVRPPRGR
jgi:photosystem II stability/assembly factor-like uncharacterized protein